MVREVSKPPRKLLLCPSKPIEWQAHSEILVPAALTYLVWMETEEVGIVEEHAGRPRRKV